MNAINEKLEQREKEGRPVKVGLIGAGQMGQEIIAMVGEMVGMEIAAVADLTADRACKGYAFSKKQKPTVEPKSPEEAANAVRDGQWIVSTDARLITALPGIEAIIDATGSPPMGAEISLDAINHRKHVVMMNVECDITVGPILKQMADNAGVVYSLASGDEPAAVLELYRFARALGFTVVAAGKGKNNPLDFYATPDTLEEKARARDMSARMLCEFVDGSKTMVEMASVSNATGLVPDTRGLHGPRCNIKDLLSVFVPREHGGILGKAGVVDYAIGDVNPSVFLIVTTDNQRPRRASCSGTWEMAPIMSFCVLITFAAARFLSPLRAPYSTMNPPATRCTGLFPSALPWRKRTCRPGRPWTGSASSAIEEAWISQRPRVAKS
jgi:predicted homoserine dehydrogenase-like protein